MLGDRTSMRMRERVGRIDQVWSMAKVRFGVSQRRICDT